MDARQQALYPTCKRDINVGHENATRDIIDPFNIDFTGHVAFQRRTSRLTMGSLLQAGESAFCFCAPMPHSAAVNGFCSIWGKTF
jgi:hypothetical protein